MSALAVDTAPADIAVVIPCHNGARFLSRALDSALVQTRPASSIYIVDEREKALVLQFGQIKQVREEPGLGFKAPYPIGGVTKYDRRNRILTTIQNTLLGTSFSEFHSGYRVYRGEGESGPWAELDGGLVSGTTSSRDRAGPTYPHRAGSSPRPGGWRPRTST